MAIRSLLALLLTSTGAIAGEADVVEVEVSRLGDGQYRFDVTVQHGDTGWDHYADAWDVLTPGGTVLDTRVLAHPHVDEQPFTRSKTVPVPSGVRQVIVRARDSVHGEGGRTIEVSLPK